MGNHSEKWRGKISLITGGSSGIGLKIAQLLAQQGSQVWLVARSMESLETALGSLTRGPDQNCGCFPADVSNACQAASAVEHVIREAGLPDLVINSAGAAHPGYVEELDIDVFRWMMEVNYFGTVHITKAVLPGMLERGSGHIVNVSSVAGFLGVFGYTAYSASKFAVRGFSDALRAEMKPHGIRVSIAYPPDTVTPQLEYENQYKPPELKALSTQSPLSPHQVASAIIQGISRGQYVILPGYEAKMLYWLNGVLGKAVYPIMDWMVTRAKKKVGS